VTLGPTGTCHEQVATEYMAFQGVDDFEIEPIGDFFDGLERIRGRDDAFLIQCSAHPKVHGITERYWAEVFVVDTFIYPTKTLAILRRREVERPRTLGLVPATSGHIDRSHRDEIIGVQSSRSSPPSYSRAVTRQDSLTSSISPPTPTSSAWSKRSVKSTRAGSSTERPSVFGGDLIGISSPSLFRPGQPSVVV
jgi:hypothetical protein